MSECIYQIERDTSYINSDTHFSSVKNNSLFVALTRLTEAIPVSHLNLSANVPSVCKVLILITNGPINPNCGALQSV